MTADDEIQQTRAEFYLCLAQAFLAPDSEARWRALRDFLADDLEDLGALLGYPLAPQLGALRRALAAIPDQPALLQRYSRLFLVPPHRVSINAGSYLDGALNGGSVQAMEARYRQAGLVRSNNFRDLSDHVSVQLEFVASRCLAGSGAEDFLADTVARWLPPFIDDLTRADAGPNPWLPLACALQAAVAVDARPAGAESAASPAQRQQAALARARHARAEAGIDAADLACIAARLREKGLAVDHLEIPAGQRDEARGWTRRVPPSPRRGARLG